MGPLKVDRPTAWLIICIAAILLIGFATWWTKSANCLWALLLLPHCKSEAEDQEEETE